MRTRQWGDQVIVHLEHEQLRALLVEHDLAHYTHRVDQPLFWIEGDGFDEALTKAFGTSGHDLEECYSMLMFDTQQEADDFIAKYDN